MGWHEMVSEGHIEKKQTRKKKKRKKRKKKRKKKLEAASGTQKAERRKRNKQKKKELRRDRRSTVIEVIGTHRTTGRSSPDTGRGATAAALAVWPRSPPSHAPAWPPRPPGPSWPSLLATWPSAPPKARGTPAAAAPRPWYHSLIAGPWVGEGTSITQRQSTGEFWEAILTKVRQIDEFVYELVIETIALYWREKVESSPANLERSVPLADMPSP